MTSPAMKQFLKRSLPKPIAYRLAALLGAWRHWRFRSYICQNRYCGETLAVRIADPTAQEWYDRDWEEALPEIEMLKRHRLKKGATIFDVGAHQAVVAILFARAVGESGKVIAVEADPWNARIAAENRSLNQANNVTVICAAAGECDSKPEHVSKSDLDRVFEWSQKKVPFRCIDSLAVEYGEPDVVYIDVDGFELSVLKGAAETLQDPVDWFVEVHVGCGLEDEGATWQEIVAFFPPNRFTRLIASDTNSRFEPFDERSAIMKRRFFFLALNR